MENTEGNGGFGFALIVVLFILLIIVGASYVGGAGVGDPVVVGFFPFFPFFW
ncbi:YjcZ family sporulation protein [Bacillus sp. FJAT-49731]|uniref:YjcZ family sporulation protein n=1 Tax=Lederbergia citrea TaxID=2833581 RepID=A0A942UTD0_9BACI|nr:YjcZ family sporulation protein [Lederbergia citrea]MBS4205841.1 YjcZ family sporulation protein [Lederbergia citrea]MBS4224711.1 YjcZ family sporulation protein [Lederbergia citrea]